MKNSANKSQKPPRIHAAGKVMTACCGNHMKCKHTVCVDRMLDILNPKQMIYTVNIVFLNGVQLWCCELLFERKERSPKICLAEHYVCAQSDNQKLKSRNLL
jgi:hypothetical protein